MCSYALIITLICKIKNCPFLSEFNPLVMERRLVQTFFNFDRGNKVVSAGDTFSDEVTEKLLNSQGQDKGLALRCALFACGNAFYDMELISRQGVPKSIMSENDISAALHMGNI